jgi:hypothetical protein
MSADLYWRPTPTNKQRLPDKLKFALRNNDSVCGPRVDGDPTTVTDSSFEYLRGLRDGGVDGAAELIAAIEKHEAVDVWLEW